MPDFSELAEVRRQARLKAREEAKREKEEFKNRLAKEYNVEGHPKLDMCFELAWEYGHSISLEEIDHYFSDLVELIK